MKLTKVNTLYVCPVPLPTFQMCHRFQRVFYISVSPIRAFYLRDGCDVASSEGLSSR